jgi:hypothetical protein
VSSPSTRRCTACCRSWMTRQGRRRDAATPRPGCRAVRPQPPSLPKAGGREPGGIELCRLRPPHRDKPAGASASHSSDRHRDQACRRFGGSAGRSHCRDRLGAARPCCTWGLSISR